MSSHIARPPSSSDSSKTFSLASRSLVLTTESDITPYLPSTLTSTSPATLTTLDLSGNTLGPAACAHLAPLLSHQTFLQRVDLHDIFTSRLLSEIPPALSSLLTSLARLPYLGYIDLSDNAFGLNTVAPLVEFLKQHVPLQELILNNNGLGPNAGAQIANALIELARRKREAGGKDGGKEIPLLETIVCGRNRLESGSTAAWSKALTAHKEGMRSVKMVQNGIRPAGIVTLLREGFASCAKLEVLDLQDNTFTKEGSHALAAVLGGWKELRELGIGDCLLGKEGGRAVMKALCDADPKQLSVLRAQFDEIDAKGLEVLVQGLKGGKLPKLRRVELNGNRFSEDDENVEALKEILEERKGDAAEGEWGLDELEDMEEDSEEEEEEGGVDEEEEEEEEEEKKRETVLKDADEEEKQKVALKKDEEVDKLADALGKTEL